MSAIMLAVMLVGTIMTPTTANAAELWTAKDPAVFQKGDTETITVTGSRGAVQWASTDPQGVVKVQKIEGNIITIECLNVGKTVMTVFSQARNESNELVEYRGSINITITDESGVSVDTLGISSSEMAANYRVEVGKSTTGAHHKTITTEPVANPSGIVTAVKKPITVNNSQSSTLQALGISNSNYYQVEYTGMAPGRTTVTYSYTDDEDDTVKKASVIVEVVPAGSLSEQASSATTNVSLKAGSSSKLSQNYYSIKDIKSSSPSIVSATPSGPAGNMNLDISAHKEGMSVITFKYQESSTSGYKESKVLFSVRAASSQTKTTSDIESGIYLTPRKANVPAQNVGKSYFTNLRINGKKIESNDTSKRNDLLWISTAASVATVNAATGEFTIKGKGTTKIVCLSKDGAMMDSVTVTVK